MSDTNQEERDETYFVAEIVRRREAALKQMLETPHKPHKPLKDKQEPKERK